MSYVRPGQIERSLRLAGASPRPKAVLLTFAPLPNARDGSFTARVENPATYYPTPLAVANWHPGLRGAPQERF